MDYTFKKRIEQFQRTVGSIEITDIKSYKLFIEDGISKVCALLTKIRRVKGNIYIIGNGGSASIASHAAVDFMNVAKLSAHTLHDSAVLTCMANDYGYENSFSSILKTVVKENDLLIAISSSGQSKNIINAVKIAKENGIVVITLSGFSSENGLRSSGDINFWSNSSDYGMVEISHQFILHNIADRFNQNSGVN
jgi:D-sedoheptulose 7-phosphate isomerase